MAETQGSPQDAEVLRQRNSWVRSAPGYKDLYMGMTAQAREHLAGPNQVTHEQLGAMTPVQRASNAARLQPLPSDVSKAMPVPRYGMTDLGPRTVTHDPVKEEAVQRYVNEQQAGLAASGLEAARSNRALAGRGVRMIKGYMQRIQSDPAGMRLSPEMQEVTAFDTYVRGSAGELTERIDKASRASRRATDPTSAAAAYKRGIIASIAGGGITGDPTNAMERTVGKPKASARRGPVGGVRGRSFAADVAGKGGIKPTIKPGTETVTTRIDPDPTPGKPRSARAEAGEGPATGTGQGPAKPVVLDLRGSGTRAGSDRGRERAPTPELQADIDRAAAFIKAHVEEHGVAPSVGKLGEGIGVNKSRAQRIMDQAQVASMESVSSKRAKAKTKKSQSAVIKSAEGPVDAVTESESLYSRDDYLLAEPPPFDEEDQETPIQRERDALKGRMKKTVAQATAAETPKQKKADRAARRTQRISDAEKSERQRAAKAAAAAERENKNKNKKK